MESQGQPCLKGLPETQTGAEETTLQRVDVSGDCETKQKRCATDDADQDDIPLPPKKRHKGDYDDHDGDDDDHDDDEDDDIQTDKCSHQSSTTVEDVRERLENLQEHNQQEDNTSSVVDKTSHSRSIDTEPQDSHDTHMKNVEEATETHTTVFLLGNGPVGPVVANEGDTLTIETGLVSVPNQIDKEDESQCGDIETTEVSKEQLSMKTSTKIVYEHLTTDCSYDFVCKNVDAPESREEDVTSPLGEVNPMNTVNKSPSLDVSTEDNDEISRAASCNLNSDTNMTRTAYKILHEEVSEGSESALCSEETPNACSVAQADTSKEHSVILYVNSGPNNGNVGEIQDNKEDLEEAHLPSEEQQGTDEGFVASCPVNIEQHMPDFQGQSHTTEGIHINFQYEDLEGKNIERFTHEDVHHISNEQSKRISMKLDLEQLQLLNVGGVEYMEGLPAALVRSSGGNEGCAAQAANKREMTAEQQDEPNKDNNLPSSHEGIIFRGDQVAKSVNSEGISIQVYPQTQGISLVTTSGILGSDMASFPTQVPTILTEGDADDTEISTTFAEQFQVATSSSALAGQTLGGDTLSVMMSPGEFGQRVVLTDQQRLLISSMVVPGMAPGQTVHISLPQTSSPTGNGTLEMTSQPEEEEPLEEGHETKDSSPEGTKGHMCAHKDCKKVCPRAHKLKLHMLSHTGERPYKCPHEGCEWAFTTAYKLKRHERGHTGERPFICPQEDCARRFTTAYNLKTHIRAHGRTNSIVCHYEGCDRAFPTMHKFRVHERKHQLEENPYRCEVDGCGKVFSAMSTLTSHLKNHSGERPHGCPVDGCEKRFTKASKLKLHLRSHTGERPFSCDEEGCGWSFTSAYKLKRHKRKHTGERPFVCSYDGCFKSFTRSSHLKTHTLVHTGERPYECPLDGCNKAFTAGSSLNIHLRKHTGEKPYRCEELSCNKAYTTAANLRAHQRRHDKTTSDKKGIYVSVLASETGDESLHTEYVTVSTVSGDSDTYPPEEFTATESVSLPAVSGHFSSHFTGHALSTIAGSSCQDFVHGVKAVSLPDSRSRLSSDKTISIPASGFQPNVDHAVHLGNVVDGSQMDVAEYVVRNDSGENALHCPETSGVLTDKHVGLFDLSISSMVSHLRCHHSPDGKLLHQHGHDGIMVDHHKLAVSSRALEFRSPINPDDQFAPPAVIFQEDSIKSGSSDAEGDSAQTSSDLPSPSQGPMQIDLPHDVIQVHFSQSTATDHGPAIDVGPVPEGHQLQTFGSPPLAEIPGDELSKPALSTYIDEHIPSEQEETNGDSYPESTINLQDLR